MEDDISFDELIAIYGISNPVTDTTVLEGINDINWSALTHAHGSAADVPACLRAALSDKKVHREVAYDLLLQSIEHQGSVFGATRYAVPFFIKMLLSEQTPNKDYVVIALWQIARDCEGVAAGEDDDEIYKGVYEEIRKGLSLYIPFLEHPDQNVRGGIVSLLCCMLDDLKKILPILEDHLKNEADEEVREEIIRNLLYYKDKIQF